MKVIVIGINGLAGSAFGRILPKMGHECIGVTRENYNNLAGTKADIVINANGSSSKPRAQADPIGEIERTVTSTMRFCNDFDCQQYVQISSGDVYTSLNDPSANTEDSIINPEKLSPYGLCKYLAECVVRNRCSNWLIIRPGGMLGPGLKKNPVYDLLAGTKIFVHPDSMLGFIHTNCLAETIINLTAGALSNEIFNIAGKGLVSMRQVMKWTNKPDISCDESLSPIRYDLSITKIEQHCTMPESKATVQTFIDYWKTEHTNAV